VAVFQPGSQSVGIPTVFLSMEAIFGRRQIKGASIRAQRPAIPAFLGVPDVDLRID